MTTITKPTYKSGTTITTTCAHTGKKMRIYVHTSEVHPDNEPFKKLIDNIEELQQRFPYVQFFRNVITGSTVQKGNGYIHRDHNSLHLEFAKNTFLRVCPYKNGLEISKIIVHEEHRGKGLGEYMMLVFFLMCVTVDIDILLTPLMLECTGQTGITQSDLSKQIKFFRKFGFRVDHKVSRYDVSYVQMNLVPEKFNEWFMKKNVEVMLESK